MTVVSQAAFASRARKKRSTHPLVAPAVLPRVRPGAELLAVVAHHPDATPVRRGMVPQVRDDILDRAERDAVAQALLGPEDRQALALVVGHVGAPEGRFGDGRRPEVRIVQDRPLVARRDQRGGHVRLPDPLGQPGAARTAAEEAFELARHPVKLTQAIGLGQGSQDRLVVAAPHDLHLSTLHQSGRRAPRTPAARSAATPAGARSSGAPARTAGWRSSASTRGRYARSWLRSMIQPKLPTG